MKQIIAHDLGIHAKKVWAASSLEDKKTELTTMINSMKFKGKILKFLQLVQTTTSREKLNKLAADIMLCDTDKVIK